MGEENQDGDTERNFYRGPQVGGEEQMTPDAKIISRLDALISAVSKPRDIQPDRRLWDADEVASILCMKVKYFREHVAPTPGFPQAIRLPLANGGKTTARWKAVEIVEWSASFWFSSSRWRIISA